MAIKRFSGSFKTRTDVFDNITPNNKVQPNVSVPAGEWKPAAWLPIVWTGESSKDSFTISSGKVVCLTREGRIAPAGLKKVCQAGAGTILTYVQADVDAGVIDITTGVAVTAAKTVSLTEFATAVVERGFVAESEVADGDWAAATTFSPGTAADCILVTDLFFSDPVGICAYDVYVWAGDSAETLSKVNYQKQHLVQFLTDIQMQVPRAVATIATSGVIASGSAEVYSLGGGAGEFFPDGQDATDELFISQTLLAGLPRYSDLAPAAYVVGYGLKHNPVAANTDRTPITSSVASVLIRERSSYNKLSKAGDWYLDGEVGIIFVHSADGTTNAATGTISYYHYAGTASTSWRQVCCVGEIVPGDYVTYDVYSNFIKSTAVNILAADDSVAASLHLDTIGRVLAIESQPKGLLDRVRTAWDGSSFTSSAQMPGTATKGFTDLITLSPETVADQVAIINVKL